MDIKFRQHSHLHNYKEPILFCDTKMCTTEEISYNDLMNLKSVNLLNCEQQKTQRRVSVCLVCYIKVSLLMGVILKWETRLLAMQEIQL